MLQQDTDEIQKITSFQVGALPFRYLGIPLTSKKLTVAQCSILVDKLVKRIRHWSSRLLSLAGRLQLVKSTLFPITNFWLQSIQIPKLVIKKVEAVFRSFLWSGGDKVTRTNHSNTKPLQTINQ